jgi:hypothetical protein
MLAFARVGLWQEIGHKKAQISKPQKTAFVLFVAYLPKA